MAFSGYDLFTVSGTALPLALGQRAPPTAAAPALQSPPAHQRDSSFLHQPQLTSCFNSPKSNLHSQNVLPHYKVQLEPLNTAQSKTPTTCTGSSFPFWRHSTFSITPLLGNTAEDSGSHCHSHLFSVHLSSARSQQQVWFALFCDRSITMLPSNS